MTVTTAWRVWVQEGKKRALIVGVFADRAKAEEHRDRWRDIGLTCVTPASPSDIEPSDYGWTAYARRIKRAKDIFDIKPADYIEALQKKGGRP
jgi:hypothetical protein